MLRAILSVIAGYAVMAVFVMAGFAVAFVVPNFAFRDDAPDVTLAWIVYALIVSFVASLVGGWVCRIIAKSATPVRVFAAIVLVFGLADATRHLLSSTPAIPMEQFQKLSVSDRAQNTRPATWYLLALPVIGAIGVFVGGRGAIK